MNDGPFLRALGWLGRWLRDILASVNLGHDGRDASLPCGTPLGVVLTAFEKETGIEF
jgi:hypothetical protein